MKKVQNNKINIIHFHPEIKWNKGDIAIAQSIEDLLKQYRRYMIKVASTLTTDDYIKEELIQVASISIPATTGIPALTNP